MSYPITTTSGATLATIADGTVNSTATSLTLIGKNYAGYGNFLNENYVKLLENFANTTEPAHAITGQLWYDSTTNIKSLKFYDGTQWKTLSSSATGSSTPTNPITGDIWWDSTNAQLKAYSGTSWVTIGPAYTSSSGTSGAITETVQDTSGTSHVIIKFYVSNVVIGIVSKDASFTPQTSISGFTIIKPGFNLISSSTLSGSQFSGDVSNALKLQDVPASGFLRADQNSSTSFSLTVGGGVYIGSDMSITPTPLTNEVQLYNTINNRDLNLYVTSGNVKTKAIGITGGNALVTFSNSVSVNGSLTAAGTFTATGAVTLQNTTTFQNTLSPNAAHTINIGSSATPFATVHAGAFSGNITGVSATYTGTATIGNAAVSTSLTLAGAAVATQLYVQTSGMNSQGTKTVSTSAPGATPGTDGDIWYQY